jgi:hypothetical protein
VAAPVKFREPTAALACASARFAVCDVGPFWLMFKAIRTATTAKEQIAATRPNARLIARFIGRDHTSLE